MGNLAILKKCEISATLMTTDFATSWVANFDELPLHFEVISKWKISRLIYSTDLEKNIQYYCRILLFLFWLIMLSLEEKTSSIIKPFLESLERCFAVKNRKIFSFFLNGVQGLIEPRWYMSNTPGFQLSIIGNFSKNNKFYHKYIHNLDSRPQMHQRSKLPWKNVQ